MTHDDEKLKAFNQRYDEEMEEFVQRRQLALILRYALIALAIGIAYFIGTMRCSL